MQASSHAVSPSIRSRRTCKLIDGSERFVYLSN